MRGFTKELTHQADTAVRYFWTLGDEQIEISDMLGRQLNIRFLGEKRCIACGRKVNKLYQGGYCFPCVTTLAETDLCIVKPHECHHHLGTCRDNEFAAAHCMIPHYVYLAVSSHAKVGLTRKHREFTRWVDQGAVKAVLIAELPTRKMAGELEMEIAKGMPDKTDWRKMVQGKVEDVDLIELASKVEERLSDEWRSYLLKERMVHEFVYPVLSNEPEPKAKSLNAEKDEVSGRLIGIRGQYLLFPDGVFQVKKHSGMLLEVQLM